MSPPKEMITRLRLEAPKPKTAKDVHYADADGGANNTDAPYRGLRFPDGSLNDGTMYDVTMY